MKKSNTNAAPKAKKPANGHPEAKIIASTEEIESAIHEWSELRHRINRFNERPLHVLQAVAAGRIRWPLMAGQDAGAERAAAETLASVRLASGLPENTFKTPGQRKIPDTSILINGWALAHLRWIQEAHVCDWGSDEIKSLPPLTKKTSRTWAVLAWAEFLKGTPSPENSQKLAAFGTHRREKYERTRDPHNREARAAQKSKKSNVRDGIREAFVAAFMRLVRD